MRALAMLWCAILVGLIGSGTFSSARIGQMTWGPAHDVWSATIAISQINLGLRGKLGYREVEVAIAGQVSASKNVWQVADDETRELLRDPAAVTRAFQAGAAVQRSNIAIPKAKSEYTTNWAEDLGYADFHNVAFRMFGFNAFATHFLYVSILTASLLLFGVSFFRDNLAVGSLVLCVTALFLEVSSSSLFIQTMPNMASNRFLSTLALVPMLHVICCAFRLCPLRPLEIIPLVAQILILAFVVSARASAQWCYLAAVFSMLAAVFLRRKSLVGIFAKVSARSITERIGKYAIRISPVGRIVTVGALLIGIVGAVGVFRQTQFDESYFWQDNMPHHMFWHSGFIALSYHPDWKTLKPYPDLPDSGDGVGFSLFERAMKENNKRYASDRNFYLVRQYETFIRDQLLGFLSSHPQYAFELFLIYKPKLLIGTLTALIDSIPHLSRWLAMVSVVLAIVIFGMPGARSNLGEYSMAFAAIWLFSLLPSFWAYATPLTIADQLWSTLFLFLSVVSLIGLGILSGSRFVISMARSRARVLQL